MIVILFFVYLVFTLLVLYQNKPPIVWEIGSIIYLFAARFYGNMAWSSLFFIGLLIILLTMMVRVQSLRLAISHFLYQRAAKSIPKLSKTEQEALDSGDTWLEEEILVNEIAPRVHNSGHHSIEAYSASQFEQHIRVRRNRP